MKELSAESEFIFTTSLLYTKMNKILDSNLYVHGISFTEYMIMHYLESSPNKMMRRIDLAQQVGLSASGVTRLIAPMVKNKIVEKESNPRDARVSLVKLSKVGERLYKDSSVTFEFCIKSITDKLSENQLEKLTELSKKIL
jgi:DNA-binding MarR family transcriptional regulator